MTCRGVEIGQISDRPADWNNLRDKMSQADVSDAVRRAMSLLKTLIVMQLIPERAEKKCDEESNHSSDGNENGGYGRLPKQSKGAGHDHQQNEHHSDD